MTFSATPVIQAERLSKVYKLYDRPSDRLKEALNPMGKKRHRLFYALREVGFQVARGEIVGIVGRNGAGKSTLVGILSGILAPSSGMLRTNGRVSALLGVGAGLNPDLTGIENILFQTTIMGQSQEEIEAKREAITAFAGIGSFIRQPLKTYSHGMIARLGFAIATHIDPEILVVDEVLAVGDEFFRRKCYAKMEAMMREGCAVIYVSHNANVINELCTRALLLDGGELLLDGPPRVVTMNYRRLLFGSPENFQMVREEILSLNRDPSRKLAMAAGRMRADAFEGSDEDDFQRAWAYHLPGMKPASTLVHKIEDVEIGGFTLATGIGERVNVLVMGDEYVVSFKIRFNAEAAGVDAGLSIQSERGVTLCYANLSKALIPCVGKGKSLTLRFHFVCNLMPGNYFVSAGASASEEEGRRSLFSIQDALVFKVQQEKRTAAIGGLAYCRQSLETELE